jgi:glycine betaine/choline ABC-type transport system substrate-binding protein
MSGDLHRQLFTQSGRCKIGVILLIVAFLLSSCAPSHSNRVVIGSKNFTESLMLGELLAQLIESRTHLKVERRFYLAGTYICQQAMLAGRIDLYPEYTGTALTAILKQKVSGDKEQVYRQVKREYESRFKFTLSPPFGFNDTFAMEIRGEDARRSNLKTISQSAQYTPHWQAGFGYELWPALRRSAAHHGFGLACSSIERSSN